MHWPHFHRDRNWRSYGVWMLQECRCGARRVRRWHWTGYSPVPVGWPTPQDRHGRPTTNSGWVKE